MSKTHARPRQTAQASTVPPQLAGLLALCSEEPCAYREEMMRAVAAARTALRDPLADTAEVFEALWSHITSEAERGNWQDLHRAIAALERPEDSPLNATTGDVQNVYGSPALLVGMAFAFVYLTEGGAR